MIRGCRGSWKFRRWKPWLSPDVGENLWLVERSVGRDGAWGSGALAGGEGEILGPVNLLRRIRESRVYVPLFGRRKLRSVIMAREQAELWKTRDNGGKAAWLFIGVLSSVYWVSDVITDDELAVLIMRACSSRNLFVKHHSNITGCFCHHIFTLTINHEIAALTVGKISERLHYLNKMPKLPFGCF